MKERSWVEINLDNFRFNIRELKRFLLPHQGFLQIVKADAYGHGAYEIAKAALAEGAGYLGVANPEEGKLLRVQGITAPILILSPALKEEIPEIIKYKLVPTISDLTFAKALSKQSSEAGVVTPVHVKIDTGMHRSGFRSEDFLSSLKKLGRMPNLEIEGVFSHFAASETDEVFSLKQLKEFERILAQMDNKPKYIHLANSAALMHNNSWQTNLVRLGIMSYGVYTNREQQDKLALRSVMTFKSVLAQVKDIKKGEYVGYNLTWKAARDGRYGIIPIGYADGYDFLLSNQGSVIINKQVCRIIGKISMDMITVDLTSIDRAKTGDEVVLMGGGTNLLRAEQLAAKYGGSAYELLCQIGRRAKRYYFDKGRLVSQAPLSRREFVSTDYSDSKLGTIISSAINQRLQDEELADLINKEVLRGFFYNKDKDIQYRKDFVHTILFIEDKDIKDYYVTKTRLQFRKVLQNDYFIVACANSDKLLKKYFLRKDVEYRWLMDTNFALHTEQFVVTKVMVNNYNLETTHNVKDSCLEIRCQHPSLSDLKGIEVDFIIETLTYYPKTSHQLSIYVTELTKGVSVKFEFPDVLKSVEVSPIFSGKDKYPIIKKTGNSLTISTNKQEWVFPNSGIIFSY